MSESDFAELSERIWNMGFKAEGFLIDMNTLQGQIRENPRKYDTFLWWLSLTADETDVEDPVCLLKDDILKY